MLRPGQAMILSVVALLVTGVVMVNSAGLSVRPDEYITVEKVLFSRSTIYAFLAIAAMVVAIYIPTLDLYKARGSSSIIPWLVAAMFVLLLLVQLPGFGVEVNGARRWFRLGAVSFQPSEFAKWCIPLIIAWHCTRRSGAMHRFGVGFVPPMILTGLICVLIALDDLGTAVLIGLVAFFMVITAGARLWHAALVIPIGLVGFLAAVIQSPYRISRLMAYADPYADPQGIGYHIIQSMSAVSGGGLVGRGLGNGIRKFGYLPEDTTDFIFAIICEELGIFGAAFVIFLYVGLLLAGIAIMRRVVHPFQRLFACGVLLTIGFQALINIAVVVGVAPTKGIALPLLSSGGTGWVLTAFSLGLLVSMDRQARLAERDAAIAEGDDEEDTESESSGTLVPAS